MQSPIRKDRFAFVALVFILATAAPVLTRVTFPAVTPYVPPSLLSSLALLTVAELLFVWRTDRILQWLRPGASGGSLGARELKIGAGVSSVLVAMLTIFWVRSWP
jgi:hypothetical protein